MTSREKSVRWLWIAGTVIWPIAALLELWSLFHAHDHAQKFSAFNHQIAYSLVWTFWSVTGLMWMQKFNKGRMATN